MSFKFKTENSTIWYFGGEIWYGSPKFYFPFFREARSRKCSLELGIGYFVSSQQWRKFVILSRIEMKVTCKIIGIKIYFYKKNLSIKLIKIFFISINKCVSFYINRYFSPTVKLSKMTILSVGQNLFWQSFFF